MLFIGRILILKNGIANSNFRFDFENMNNLGPMDLYLTMGNTSAQTPLQLNGASFSVKLGVLVNKMVHNNLIGGGAHNERVYLSSTPRNKRPRQ